VKANSKVEIMFNSNQNSSARLIGASLAHRTKPSKSRRAPGALAIYAGASHVGTVIRRDGHFIALAADGRELGRYETLRAACHAIPSSTDEFSGRSSGEPICGFGRTATANEGGARNVALVLNGQQTLKGEPND
jgi:hypothetical protein